MNFFNYYVTEKIDVFTNKPFNIHDVKNRRFMYNTKTNEFILGGDDINRNSHAEEYSKARRDGKVKGKFDDFVRGWVGTSDKYKNGIIHFAPNIPEEAFKDADIADVILQTIEYFLKSGANEKTILRNILKAGEYKVKELFPYFFVENYIPELYELIFDELNEVNKNLFITNTDPARIKRARKEVRTRPPKVTEGEDGYDRLEYNFKAFPSTEFKRHWGYVDHKGTDIRQLFCDCKDFFYRLYAPMVKKGLATWNLPAKYKTREIKRHNREWTNITNPEGKVFVCKHLYALITEYINDENDEVKAKPVLKKPEKKPEKIEPKKPTKKPSSAKERQAEIDQRRKEKDQQDAKRKAEFELRRQKLSQARDARDKSQQRHIGKTDKELQQAVDTAIDELPEE